jgi:hypothetical protein
MEQLSLSTAEELAERCLDACNRFADHEDVDVLNDMFTPDLVVDVVENTSYVLTGIHEFAEILRAKAHHGGLILFDAHEEGDEVVAGVAWGDDPTIRIAEVRMFRDGDRISRLEWME